MAVWSNGNIVNVNNSYGAISDGDLKYGVKNANSSWEEFKKYRFVNYYLKEDDRKKKLLGVISQEIERVSPSLVSRSPVLEEVIVSDLDGVASTEMRPPGEFIQSINYSVLYLKAAVALKEALKRIEALEAIIKKIN
ncbi:tail fiber domain-containing protein [Kluyvera sp. CHPC 1.251]|uniref:tail fiber domain-containing protein n=1 Tax=Kluyvera sp. CHPC 1.251 TaxID=2995175 RepID=UPI002FD824DD